MDLIQKIAGRCAEIVMETRQLSRSERKFHADANDLRALMDCAYRESAYRILLEFGLPLDSENRATKGGQERAAGPSPEASRETP